ncbi:hypothetical protein BHM03_00060008 [Ensete ventricosum]|nr:hypothetical protein BHM03_00060008 [Ensete ventricosum]
MVNVGDLVLRKAKVSNPEHSLGKLAPRWEGLYRVVRAIQDETYVLTIMEGQELPRMWHTSNLKKFYVSLIRRKECEPLTR